MNELQAPNSKIRLSQFEKENKNFSKQIIK